MNYHRLPVTWLGEIPRCMGLEFGFPLLLRAVGHALSLSIQIRSRWYVGVFCFILPAWYSTLLPKFLNSFNFGDPSFFSDVNIFDVK